MIVTMKFAPATQTEIVHWDAGGGQTETLFNIHTNINGAALYLADTREGGKYYIVVVQVCIIPYAEG